MSVAELAPVRSRVAGMHGRHPRLLLSTADSEEESHHKNVASVFADDVYYVDITPKNSYAQSIARQAVECDADILVLIRLSLTAEDRVGVADVISSLAALDAEYIKFGIVGKTDDPARDNVDFVFDLEHLGTDDCEALVGYILEIEEDRVAQHI